MKLRIPFLIILCALLPAASRAAVRVQVQANGQNYTGILVNGSATSKYDIVFIGDGFREADQTAFNTAVTAAVDALRNRPGYAERMCGFNIWRVNVISTDQGIDHPKDNVSKNTELDCRYGNPANGEAERCIVTDSPAKCIEAAAYAPGRDATFVLVNDTQWGGCAGAIVCSSIAPGFAGIITHELGHKLAKLADEYDCYVCDGSDDNRTYSGPDRPEVNITNDTNRATTKWRDLIATTTAIPTVADTPPGVVGLWEGGGYFRRSLFRPQSTCHMRAVGSGFCAVCMRKVQADLEFRCSSVLDALKNRRFIWKERFRMPIPICLSCPKPQDGNPLDLVTLSLAGLPQDAAMRILDSKGNVVVEAKVSERGLSATFESSRAERYYADVIPAQGMAPQEVTLKTELSHNLQIQELPTLRMQ